MSGQNRLVGWVVWKARAQRGMWSFTVVMRNPLHKNRPQMPFVEWNHPIETLAPCRSDEAFTMRVRLCPFRPRVVGEIPVHDPACADVEKDEHVQSLEGGRHHDEEVAGEDGAGVIVEECRP